MANYKIEFISERKIVKTMINMSKALLFIKDLRNARVKDQTSLKSIWDEVGKILKVDPFLPLSIRVKDNNNKIIGSQMIWKNTL